MLKIYNLRENESETAAFLERVKTRGDTADVSDAVSEIIRAVKLRGDAAVREYTEKFDGKSLYYEVPRDVINAALTKVSEDSPKFIDALLTAQANIAAFHERQRQNGFAVTRDDGVIMGQRVRGLHRVGLYVPGGTAAYPSSVLMNAVPAKIAGVGEILMVTPPGKDGRQNDDILAAAAICGVDRVFMCGGAQAVAALAYGTDVIPKVDKIVGPGNIYVATAKKLLFGVVYIDMIAGPSENLIIADSTALEGDTPLYIAADLCSQAEHDRLASAILVTDCEPLAARVNEELDKLLSAGFGANGDLSRVDIVRESLASYGGIVVAGNTAEMISAAETAAPEHLEVMCADPMRFVGKLDNVGSLFLGRFSHEPLGDYYAGPNHVLPTGGTAAFFSPLSVDSFVKKSSYIYYTEDALAAAADDIILLAEKERLPAHANSVYVRKFGKTS